MARFCKSCDICQRTIRKGCVTKDSLGKLPLIDTPFKPVSVQLVRPIEPRSDKKSILTMMDYATRYPEAVVLPSIETERAAEALIAIFSRVGIPIEMLIEHESRVTIEVMNEVSRLLSLQQLTTVTDRTVKVRWKNSTLYYSKCYLRCVQNVRMTGTSISQHCYSR